MRDGNIKMQGDGYLPEHAQGVWQEKEDGMILKNKAFKSGYRANSQGQELHTSHETNQCSENHVSTLLLKTNFLMGPKESNLMELMFRTNLR